MSGSAISLIAGLGNPGARYSETRHNAGFWFVDELARRHGATFRSESKFSGEVCRITAGGEDYRLFKPMTFMNRCGQAISQITRFYRISPEQLLVVHDDLDLAPGVVRFKQGGGHGGHNGLRDIMSALGGAPFARLRLGIGHPGNRDDVVDYVLRMPGRAERELLDNAVVAAVESTPALLQGEYQAAMNRLHSRSVPAPAAES